MSHRTYEEIAIDPWGDYRGIIVDSGWTIDGFLTYIQSLLTPHEPSTDRRDLATFPVGPPDVLQIPPLQGNELPDVVFTEPPLPVSEEAIYREISTREVKEEIVEQYVLVIGNTTYRGTLEDLGNHPNAVPAGGYGVTDPSLIEQTENILTTPIGDLEADDVTDLFHDLGDAAVDIILGNLGLGFTDNNPPNTGTTPPDGGSITANGTNMSVPAVCNTGASPVYKKVCGVYKWVYPKRRRRRTLLTESDYNALLRVQNLKVNQNMTVAIAKALTR